MYINLTTQTTLRRAMDVVANNVANMNTIGFKAEQVMMEPETMAPASMRVGPEPIKFVTDWGQWRDMTEGAIEQTSNPLDFAIGGEGFFEIDTPNGPRYTRAGNFTLDDAGQLVTQDGHPVIGDGGAITLLPDGGRPTVSKDGTISQNGEPVGRLTAVSFANNKALEKVGNNMFASEEPPQAAPAASINQGMLERSNVNGILEMTRLMEIQKAYKRASDTIGSMDDMAKRTIQRFGRNAQ